MPLRTCIGCRCKVEQNSLIRIARRKNRQLGLWDGQGRSAYVHHSMQCIEAALGKGKLERALKEPVTFEERNALKEELACQLR